MKYDPFKKWKKLEEILLNIGIGILLISSFYIFFGMIGNFN